MAKGGTKSSVARLVAINAADPKSREFTIKKAECSVGNDETNDFVIRDGTVSQHHAILRRRRRKWEVADLDSTNGTFVDNRRITGPQVVHDGQDIRFGGVRFVFHVESVANANQLAKLPRRRRSFSMRTAVEIIVLAFLFGFALTQYLSYLNYRSLGSLRGVKQTPAAAPSETARTEARATVAPAPKPSEANKVIQAPSWLDRVNYWRGTAKLPPVTDNPLLSEGDFKHSRYLVKNYAEAIKRDQGGLGISAHTEDPVNRWFSTEGLAAARSSDISEAWLSDGRKPDSSFWAIDGLVAIPFHRLWILNPYLLRAGYGEYCEHGVCAAALNVLSETDQGHGRVLSSPIEFPANESSIGLSSFRGEWPDPLTACPGYIAPSGLPVTLELGWRMLARLSSHVFTKDGEVLETCGFDAATYTNPEPSTEERGRGVLTNLGAVVIIPRLPLSPGGTYEVSVTVSGRYYHWSFSVAADAKNAR